MAQFISIADRFNNRDKRYAESVVMTCPAVYEDGSPRTGSGDKEIASGDAYTAAIIEPGTIVKKAYLIIDEAFPTGAKISVDIAGTAFFTDVAGDATGVTVSTVEDKFFQAGQTITVGIVAGTAGTPVKNGVARVVLDTVSTNLKNGNYAG